MEISSDKNEFAKVGIVFQVIVSIFWRIKNHFQFFENNLNDRKRERERQKWNCHVQFYYRWIKKNFLFTIDVAFHETCKL